MDILRYAVGQTLPLGVFDGTGNITSPGNNGNVSLLSRSDNHPTPAGDMDYATRIAQFVARASAWRVGVPSG